MNLSGFDKVMKKHDKVFRPALLCKSVTRALLTVFPVQLTGTTTRLLYIKRIKAQHRFAGRVLFIFIFFFFFRKGFIILSNS